jgi:hypothetical protein
MSDERAAADALQAGDLPEALSLYERLAADQPANPAFARVVQILRKRLGSAQSGASSPADVHADAAVPMPARVPSVDPGARGRRQ